jgi:glycosyltransferase involved in cell wall biosynthesis
MKRSSLTIVIATYNRAKSLNKCLKSLTIQSDKGFDILIIDGGSDDKTNEIIDNYKSKLSIRIIVDKKSHLAYIRDLGWRKAKGEIIAWIDDDTIVEKQWVEAVKNAFKAEPLESFKARPYAIGGVTGPTVIPKKLLHKRDVFYFHTTKSVVGKLLAKIYFSLFMQGEKYAIGKIYPSGAWSPGSNFPQSKKLKKPIEVDYLEACNFAVVGKILEEVNGFDLNYKETSEWCEVDLAFRIRKAGYKLIFDPKVAVEHHVSSSGVYARRASPFHRLQNFARFYIFTYYPKTPRGIYLFFLYFKFLLVYYLLIYLSAKSFISKKNLATTRFKFKSYLL